MTAEEQALVAELQAKVADQNRVIAQLRKDLTGAQNRIDGQIAGLSKEAQALVKEKVAAGLTTEMAINVVQRQMEHDKTKPHDEPAEAEKAPEAPAKPAAPAKAPAK